MPEVVIYTKTTCPYCDRAKALLKGKGLSYREIDITGNDDELKKLTTLTGFKTVPQIFINQKFIGGFTDLSALQASGELDRIIEK